jgi:hypothetical protein
MKMCVKEIEAEKDMTIKGPEGDNLSELCQEE